MPSVEFPLPKGNTRPDSVEDLLAISRLHEDCTHEYGIFVDLSFGWDHEGALQAVAAFREKSIDVSEAEESSCGWSVRLSIGLEFNDLNRSIDTIEQIAGQYGGTMLTDPTISQDRIRKSGWERLWRRWKRYLIPSKRSDDFVDRSQWLELY